MSLPQFQRAVKCINLQDNDRKWVPKWLTSFAKHHRLDCSSSDKLIVTRETVITFLRALRDRGVPAWQRLQAARALKAYQSLILRSETVDLEPILEKLRELAGIEKQVGGRHSYRARIARTQGREDNHDLHARHESTWNRGG